MPGFDIRHLTSKSGFSPLNWWEQGYKLYSDDAPRLKTKRRRRRYPSVPIYLTRRQLTNCLCHRSPFRSHRRRLLQSTLHHDRRTPSAGAVVTEQSGQRDAPTWRPQRNEFWRRCDDRRTGGAGKIGREAAPATEPNIFILQTFLYAVSIFCLFQIRIRKPEWTQIRRPSKAGKDL